jgi:RHS repeat-associated protein
MVIQAGTLSQFDTSCVGTGDQYESISCSMSLMASDGGSSSLFPTNSSNWESIDGAGYRVSNYTPNAGLPNTMLLDRNGTSYPGGFVYYIPGYPDPLYANGLESDLPGGIEDTNGNEINAVSPNGIVTNWLDTEGRSIPLPISETVSSSGCPQTPLPPNAAYYWDFPGVNGGTYKVTFCYVNVAYKILWEGNYATGNLIELQSVLLPNGTSWTFQYTTDGNGDLAQITFPTGGTLSYTWIQGGDACVVHTYSNARSVATRTLNANSSDSSPAVWTYQSLSPPTVTDPAGNDTVHTFTNLATNGCPYYETVTKYYQGSHTTGTLLKTVNTTYSLIDGSISNDGQPTTANVVWPSATNNENQTTYGYDTAVQFYTPTFKLNGTGFQYGYPPTTGSYGLALTKKEYDYGTGAPGTLLRTTTTNYQAFAYSNYLTNNLLTLPSSVAVTGSGPGSTTTYDYDQTTPVSSYITTQHNSAPPAGSYRGNPTTVSRYLNTTGTYLSTTSTNWDTGMVDVVTDPKGNQTTYGYSSTYAGSLLTSVTNAANQTTTYAYDFNTGLLTSTTDPNGLITGSTYDDMERLTLATNPDGGQVAYTYNDTTPSPSVDINITANSSGGLVTGAEILDGLGRLKQKQLTSDPSGTDLTDYTYDALGRASTVSNPYRGSPTNLLTTYSYDALSRNTNTTEADGSIRQAQYCGSSTLTIDEAGIWKRTVADGLGRIIEADEPTSSSSTQNACAGQGGPVYATTYSYDVNGNVTGVLQAGSRQRTFVYDSLSRLTSSINPESNTEAVSPYTSVPTTYTYDGDGNVLSKTGPAPNQQSTTTQTISYCYDALNRVIQKAYALQSCPMSAPTIAYAYDGSGSGTVNIGHRTSMTEASGGSESWTYTINKTTSPKGLLVLDSRTTNGVLKSSSYQYNYDGSLGAILYPSGRTITYSYNAAAQPTAAADNANSISYVSDGFYAPHGGLTTESLGVAIAHTIIYNSRLQPCWSWAGTGTSLPSSYLCTATATTGTVLDLKYNYNLGTNNGNLAGITNDRDSTRSQTFTYDPLSRLATAAASTYATSHANCWGEQFGYDTSGDWGNLLSISPISSAYTGCTQESLSETVSAYNRVAGLTYDSAGNMTTIPSPGGAYAFNAENLITSTAGVNYTYDGDNERVEKSSGTLYWHGPDGMLLDETDLTGSTTNSSLNEYVYFNGERIARRDSSNDVFYYFNDQIGSTRAIAEVLSGQRTATLCFDTDYYPFGTQRTPIVSTCTTNYKFTNKQLDTESSLYNSNARYYPSFQGRFISPDPAGMDAVDISDPQSLNLYAYVRNSPLAFIDSTGMDDCPAGDEPTCTPGALTFFAGPPFYDPEAAAEIKIPPNFQSPGDDCGSNPYLNGCPSGPDLSPVAGWNDFFHGGSVLPPQPWKPSGHTGPKQLRPRTDQEYNACLSAASSNENAALFGAGVEVAGGIVAIEAGGYATAVALPEVASVMNLNSAAEGFDLMHAGGFAYAGAVAPIIPGVLYVKGIKDATAALNKYNADLIHCAAAVPQ